MPFPGRASCNRPAWGAIAVALLATGCYPPIAPPELTEGVWSGTDRDRRLVFELTSSHLGVHALIHVLEDGRKVTEKRASRVEFEPTALRIWWGGGLCYTANVDLERRRMTGEVTGAGPPRPLMLERVDPASVAGLYARPGMTARTRHAWTLPPVLGDGWDTARPEDVGLRRAPLEELVTAIVEGQAGVLHSLLIVKDGKLVVEEYFHGYTHDDLHAIGECTHGVVSLLIGIAVDRGRIVSPEVAVLDFFPELRSSAAAGWDRVTLEHVLTMTTGRRYESARRLPIEEAGEALFARTLSRGPADEPGTRWAYSDQNINLLSGVLRAATAAHADELATDWLFGPLGVEAFEWRRSPRAEFPPMNGGLHLRPRDLAKLGQLVLDGGRWNGRRIVSAEWIRESTSNQLDLPIAVDEQYGYLWWLPPLPDSDTDRLIAASGWGSQFLYVVPSKGTVVTVNGGNEFNRKSFLPLQVLARYILPAFEQ